MKLTQMPVNCKWILIIAYNTTPFSVQDNFVKKQMQTCHMFNRNALRASLDHGNKIGDMQKTIICQYYCSMVFASVSRIHTRTHAQQLLHSCGFSRINLTPFERIQ